MPLPLNDDRWKTLWTAYKSPDCDELIEWLSAAYKSGMSDELLGDIINEIQHQGDTSQAMYAVAPHLLAIASTCEGEIAVQLIVSAGLIHAYAQSENAVVCPPDLLDEFEESKIIGRKMVLIQLEEKHDFDNFKSLLASLSGFCNHGRFGRLIEGFELFENQFHHGLLDTPFDDDP